MYESLNAAAKGLLGEATAIAQGCNVDFAVCGGWSPFLRNSYVVGHPGTRDVDLLFSEGSDKGSLKSVVSAFLDSGYIVSAKCEFQVLRILPVAGRDFVFNVDLLHPHEGTLAGEFCVDQLSLPIPHEDFKSTFVFMKSIALSNAGFVFDGYVEDERIVFQMPNGSCVSLDVPIIDEVGLIATKGKSCIQRNCPRDIFDIYLAIKYPRSLDRFKTQLRRLRSEHDGVYASLEYITEGIKAQTKYHPSEIFAERGIKFDDAAKEMQTFIDQLDFSGMNFEMELEPDEE